MYFLILLNLSYKYQSASQFQTSKEEPKRKCEEWSSENYSLKQQNEMMSAIGAKNNKVFFV